MPEPLADTMADLKAWMLLHRVRDLAVYLEDRLCSQYGLTVEQYTVLVAIRSLDAPVTVADVARWTGHWGNAASTIVDRMVNAGLLRRTRDMPDRRLVRVAITRKGDELLKQATPAVWAFIEDTMAPLSQEEKRTLIDLLEKVRTSELRHFQPHQAARVSSSYETTDLPRLITRLRRYAPACDPKLKRPTLAQRQKRAQPLTNETTREIVT